MSMGDSSVSVVDSVGESDNISVPADPKLEGRAVQIGFHSRKV